jgi:hypothetical protein
MAKKCEFRKKDGGRCGANAQAGTNSCIFHDPDKAAEGQRARRSGGISRSRPAAVLPLDVPDNHLRSTQDVARLLAGSINQVRRGQIDPRVANATGYLAGILLKALEQGRTEQRLAQLESILGCNKGCDGEIFNFVTQGADL